MKKKKLVLVSGVSGAGKTIAMDYFDKLGFYCIDNLPVKALISAVDALQEDTYFDLAIALNANTSEKQINHALSVIDGYDWLNMTLLFLDVSDDVLIQRFQMTRKQHPLSNEHDSLVDCINQERKLLQPFRVYANIVIDTTRLSDTNLKQKISQHFKRNITDNFRLCFISYGYKHGIPKDLDYAFDLRFIPNPFYIEELRSLSGNDQLVYDFVMAQQETKDFLKYLIPLLDYTIAMQQKIDRGYLVIGLGCTGGVHRSVSLCNYLSDYYDDQYSLIKEHRNVHKN
ncbi:MAG: RNase adapter RapZ [Bacilli bacterium]